MRLKPSIVFSPALPARSSRWAPVAELPRREPTPHPDPPPSPPERPCPRRHPTPASRRESSGCGQPYPPPLHGINVKLHIMAPEYFTLDATPLVGPNSEFCREIGYTDGREFCPVRVEKELPSGAPVRGLDHGQCRGHRQAGPDLEPRLGALCMTFEASGCQHNPDNPLSLFIQLGGKYQACKGEEDLRPGRDRSRAARMTAEDATATGRIFAHDRLAGGYASARPYLHPEVFARVRAAARPLRSARPSRALDVGCGTGMSSVALLGPGRRGRRAPTPRLPMLPPRAPNAERIRYVGRGRGGRSRFASGAFDLVVACGSIDWVDRVVASCRGPPSCWRAGGCLVALDFGDAGPLARRRRPRRAGTGDAVPAALPAPARERPRHRSRTRPRAAGFEAPSPGATSPRSVRVHSRASTPPS